MKIRIIADWENEIKYKVEFRNPKRGVIRRVIHRYTYAIHRISYRIIELETKSLWSI